MRINGHTDKSEQIKTISIVISEWTKKVNANYYVPFWRAWCEEYVGLLFINSFGIIKTFGEKLNMPSEPGSVRISQFITVINANKF